MSRGRATASLCLALAACGPAPGPAAHLKLADIQPILQPLALRELLGETCGVPDTAVKTAFLTDLEKQGASADLLKQASEEAARVMDSQRGEPKGYVCTPEMFESTETMAFAARMAWAEMKTRKKKA